MGTQSNEETEHIMNLKKIAIAAAAGASLFAALPAFANGWDHGRHYGHYGHSYRAPVVVYRQAPVYYAPAPVYYPPAPVYYAPPPPRVVYPAPVVYGRVPVGNTVISFGARF
jgi:hypothetical protein